MNNLLVIYIAIRFCILLPTTTVENIGFLLNNLFLYISKWFLIVRL